MQTPSDVNAREISWELYFELSLRGKTHMKQNVCAKMVDKGNLNLHDRHTTQTYSELSFRINVFRGNLHNNKGATSIILWIVFIQEYNEQWYLHIYIQHRPRIILLECRMSARKCKLEWNTILDLIKSWQTLVHQSSSHFISFRFKCHPLKPPFAWNVSGVMESASLFQKSF